MTAAKTNPTANAPAESPEIAALKAQLAKLQAENEALSKAKRVGLTYKVSEKGALSVYGLGRFPVTLYREQWATLFDNRDAILAFIEANKGKLTTKADKVAAEQAKDDAERKARVAAYEQAKAAEAAAKVG